MHSCYLPVPIISVSFFSRKELIEPFNIPTRDKKKVLREENVCVSGQIRDLRPSVIIYLNSGLVKRVRGRAVNPGAHQIHHLACSRLIMLLSALSSTLTHTHAPIHTLAGAAEIRWTTRWMQLKRSSVIKVFLRSAKVFRGFLSLKSLLLGPVPAAAVGFQPKAA